MRLLMKGPGWVSCRSTLETTQDPLNDDWTAPPLGVTLTNFVFHSSRYVGESGKGRFFVYSHAGRLGMF